VKSKLALNFNGVSIEQVWAEAKIPERIHAGGDQQRVAFHGLAKHDHSALIDDDLEDHVALNSLRQGLLGVFWHRSVFDQSNHYRARNANHLWTSGLNLRLSVSAILRESNCGATE
jgi:hypothetical protein